MRQPRASRTATLALTATMLLALAAAASRGEAAALATGAAQTAKIAARFSPERLGRHTTTTLAFQVKTGKGIPSPLTGIDFEYPRSLGIATSDLGTATCDPQALAARGPKVCPPNSVMGRGQVAVEVPLGPEVVPETAAIALVAGPSHNGDLNLLISATGESPVAARIVMPTTLENGHMHVQVPLVQSLPEGPDVAVVSAKVTLGGNLTYYQNRKGHRTPYHPRGILLPKRCPRGGFRFAGAFAFQDGTKARAQTTVACPDANRALSG